MDVDETFAAAIASRYRIERKLGEGGMAIVYLARDTRHGRQVALKVLRPELATTLGAERFLREITIAARLVHPNILPLHDSGEAAGHLYYVMPYVEGATLRQRLDREKQLPLADVADITSQIAAALDHAHARGVVHRDVKPDNVLLVDGRVLVADFGLARALTSAVSTPLTRTGTVVGTPAYMSPEQCAPGEAVDARSDVYALACMTFEMIAGVTPFRGATAQAMMAHQISGDPPSVCAERERCPKAVDEVLKRGLAKSPADRYQRAGELAVGVREAVAGVTGPSTATNAAGGAWRGHRRRLLSAGALTLAIVAGGWFVARSSNARSTLDRNVYVVFPPREDSTPAGRTYGPYVREKLGRAMALWSGFRHVDDLRVDDLWARQPPRTVNNAISDAGELGAGMLAWGEVRVVGDSLEIHPVVYDVSAGENASRDFRAYIPLDEMDSLKSDSVFAALAQAILGGSDPPGISIVGTTNSMARDQFKRGYEARGRFDLRTAQAHFDSAVVADENFALAHLWAARVRAWRGEAAPDAWLADARRAVNLSASLPEVDRTHALALLDLAEGRAPQACALYRSLLQRDSADVAAWLGLGDCNARDDAVVPDPRSPGKRVFRGSYSTAVDAYEHALILVPSLQQAEKGAVFKRLAGRVLFTEESKLRRGVGVRPDTQRYAAFPSFAGESVAFEPAPFEQVIRTASHPGTERSAVRWAAAKMRDLMDRWRQAFPRSADAQASYAVALEAWSAISGPGAPPPDALGEARKAALNTDSADLRMERFSTVVRLLIKADSLEAARALSDSLLAATPTPTPRQAGYLGNLAALTGRAREAAALLWIAAADSEHIPFRDANDRPPPLPMDLMGALLQLRAYAALDGPRDSLLATFRRVNRLIDRYVEPARRDTVKSRVMRTPAVLASADFGVLTLAPLAAHDDLLAMRAAIMTRNEAAARQAGARFQKFADSYSPGTIGPDRSLAFAIMLLSLRDTAAATDRLDAALDAIPRARSVLLSATPQGAAIGRLLLLRARLAYAAHDPATARRRANQLDILWRHADSDVRAPLDTLRRQL